MHICMCELMKSYTYNPRQTKTVRQKGRERAQVTGWEAGSRDAVWNGWLTAYILCPHQTDWPCGTSYLQAEVT